MNSFDLSDFDYSFPQTSIAHQPCVPRDHARLLVLNRKTHHITHSRFNVLTSHLSANDVLVINDTKVMPSRLRVHKKTGKTIDLLLLEAVNDSVWRVLSKPGLPLDCELFHHGKPMAITTKESDDEGVASIRFLISPVSIRSLLHRFGEMPLPPYIKTTQSQSILKKQYQTVFARDEQSAAAPTASLHFTHRLLKQLKENGVTIVPLTLSVGLGTFKPLTTSSINQSTLHQEHYIIPASTLKIINSAKSQGKRIVAAGTTVTRALESSVGEIASGKHESTWKTTSLFIKPPYKLRVVDALITNFHVPQSSLLMMVSAFASFPNSPNKFSRFETSLLGNAYAQAISRDYRLFSFGDAMFIC